MVDGFFLDHAGAGNAVFSVSSFMDTLDPDEVPVEEAVPA